MKALQTRKQSPLLKTADRRDRGMMLVTVLWIVAMLGLVVSAFNGNVRTGIALRKTDIAIARAEALARGGLMLAATRIQVEGNSRWEPDGRIYRTQLGDARLAISVQDANGLVDINLAKRDLLEAMLTTATGSSAKARQIATFIMAKRAEVETATESRLAKPAFSALMRVADRDTAASTRAPIETKTHLAFRDLSQLGDAPGISTRLMASLAEELTVYGRTGRLNPATAPQHVLAAVPGLNSADAAAIVSLRWKQTELDALMARLNPAAQRYLSREYGPAFLVKITVQHPEFPSPIDRSSVILIDKDDVAGMRILQPLSERNP